MHRLIDVAARTHGGYLVVFPLEHQRAHPDSVLVVRDRSLPPFFWQASECVRFCFHSARDPHNPALETAGLLSDIGTLCSRRHVLTGLVGMTESCFFHQFTTWTEQLRLACRGSCLLRSGTGSGAVMR